MKQCSQCGEWKTAGNFIEKGDLCGHCFMLAHPNDWWPRLQKEFRRLDSLARQKAHPEQRRESVRRWAKRHPEKARERYRLYYAEHTEERREYQRRWYAEHPEKARALSHNRRARLQAAPGFHTAEDIRLQQRAQTDKKGRLICWWCDGVIEDGYHVDHRIPLDKGGSNGPENIVLAHAKCNLSKGAKLPGEFNGRLL